MNRRGIYKIRVLKDPDATNEQDRYRVEWRASLRRATTVVKALDDAVARVRVGSMEVETIRSSNIGDVESVDILSLEYPAELDLAFEDRVREFNANFQIPSPAVTSRAFAWASSLISSRLSNEEIGDMIEAIVAAGYTGWQYRLRVTAVIMVFFWNAMREALAGFVAKRRGGS